MGKEMRPSTLLIDGPYLAHKSHQAPYKLTTSKGLNSTMIHTFLRSLNALRKQFNPDNIVIAWESHGTPSWRKELVSSYKPSKPFDISFVTSLKDIQILLYLLGYDQYYSECNEADDVIASYVENHLEEDIIIYTVDKDIMQLLQKTNCSVYDGHKKVVYNDVYLKYGIKPNQIPDLLALAGDNVDNIEGIKGIGFKKAAKIINKYGCVENIPFSICSLSIPNLEMEKVLLNKKLATLNKECELVEYKPPFETTIDSILDKYELKKIKEEINKFKFEKKQPSLESFF